MGRAAALRADLHDPPGAPRGGEHRLPLDDVDADRLLHINIRARLDRGDHRQGVPMIRRGDEHNVEVFLLEHLAIVGIGARLLLRDLPSGDHVRGVGEHLLIDVAQRNDLDRRDLDQAKQISLAIPPAADEPDPRRFLIDKLRGKPARGGERQPRGARVNELSTIHGGAPR